MMTQSKMFCTTPGDALSQVWPAFLRKANLRDSDVRLLQGELRRVLDGDDALRRCSLRGGAGGQRQGCRGTGEQADHEVAP